MIYGPFMYAPQQFREERADVLTASIRDIGLAALATFAEGELHVSHVPMVLKEGPVLETHVARPNGHWRLGGPTVAIFQGPQAYVSPSFYASKREHGRVVPTWNYVAVHAHGTLEAVDDAAWLRAHLDDLVREREGGRAQPWEVNDAPAEFIAKLAGAIVGLRLTVTRLEGAWKMIQHRSEGDRLGTIAGLAAEGSDVADVMRALEAARQRR